MALGGMPLSRSTKWPIGRGTRPPSGDSVANSSLMLLNRSGMPLWHETLFRSVTEALMLTAAPNERLQRCMLLGHLMKQWLSPVPSPAIETFESSGRWSRQPRKQNLSLALLSYEVRHCVVTLNRLSDPGNMLCLCGMVEL